MFTVSPVPPYHLVTGMSPGLVDFQASERLEDEVAEPMELASLWCLGFTPNKWFDTCHVDTC